MKKLLAIFTILIQFNSASACEIYLPINFTISMAQNYYIGRSDTTLLNWDHLAQLFTEKVFSIKEYDMKGFNLNFVPTGSYALHAISADYYYKKNIFNFFNKVSPTSEAKIKISKITSTYPLGKIPFYTNSSKVKDDDSENIYKLFNKLLSKLPSCPTL